MGGPASCWQSFKCLSSCLEVILIPGLSPSAAPLLSPPFTPFHPAAEAHSHVDVGVMGVPCIVLVVVCYSSSSLGGSAVALGKIGIKNVILNY